SAAQQFKMQFKAILSLLACSCVITQTDAFGFLSLIPIVKVVVDAASDVLGHVKTPRFTYADNNIEIKDFQSSLMMAHSGCIAPWNADAGPRCLKFGATYGKEERGRWGCAMFFGDETYACMFKPERVHKGPDREDRDIVFYDDIPMPRITAKAQCAIGRKVRRAAPNPDQNIDDPSDPDTIEPAFNTADQFFSQTLITELNSFSASSVSVESSEMTQSVISVGLIRKTLGFAGIRYPIGRRLCQLCK
ncbi:hypothetical protein BGW38_008304, partial [Lunasporangiospora selenospora]